MLPLPVFNLKPERKRVPHSCSEYVSTLQIFNFNAISKEKERRHLLVGDSHADVWGTHKRRGRIRWVSHPILWKQELSCVDDIGYSNLKYIVDWLPRVEICFPQWCWASGNCSAPIKTFCILQQQNIMRFHFLLF